MYRTRSHSRAYSLAFLLITSSSACAGDPSAGSSATGSATVDDAGRGELAPAPTPDAALQPVAPPAPIAAPSSDAGVTRRECAAASAVAQARLLPSDIVWSVDTSGSLALAFDTIQQALNVFSQRVVAAGVDAHVIVLAGATGGRLSDTGVCVAPPLGSGRCGAPANPGGPAPDSNEPKFLHLDTPIAANAGMSVLLDSFARYKHLLRPDARTQLVLTEDGAPFGRATDTPLQVTTQAVIDHLEGRRSATQGPPFMPGLLPSSWTFNAVVCKDGLNLGSCLLGGEPPPATLELVSMTRGILADLNNAGVTDMDPFAELVDKLAQNVISEAQLGCSYEIPPVPDGMLFVPGEVNVVYTSGEGVRVPFLRVPDASPCAQNEGWKYDQPVKPSRVQLCPVTCAWVQRDARARIDLQFGCESNFVLL